MDLNTKTKITWCPGCPNFGILAAFKSSVSDLVKAREINLENLAIFSGIGCHGKITEYLNLNTFTSLHGRAIPLALGAKIANPKLKAIAFVGDGDVYAEGLDHLIHAAKKNSDMTIIVHNNQVFALTTGQFTPTSPKGLKSKSSPKGSIEEPLNPLTLILSAGASFVARSYALEIEKTKKIITAAIQHRGFSFVEIIQPCITFYDTREILKNKIKWLDEKYKTNDFYGAFNKISKSKEKMPLGIFYQVKKPIFEDEV
ncbi:MAG: thiamine pyrophosphate-dependent enzyme [Patescibacteria group bacterium]|jgi:2-oxoglutarate ferredoxin oxidoreductase subunit beta